MLTTLTKLDVSSTPIEQIGGLPKNLRVFDIHKCAHVKELPNLSQLNWLQYLDVSGCKQVEEIHGVDQLQNLKHLDCSGTSIRYLPDLSMLTTLDWLDVSSTPIEQIGGLPIHLKAFDIHNCAQVKELPNLSQLGRLENLDVSGCKEVEEIHGIDQLQNLIDFKCGGTSIRYLPDLSMLTMLNPFDVSSTSIEQIGGLPIHLKVFRIDNFARVKDLSQLGCKLLEEIRGVDLLQNLEDLNCSGTNIRYLRDLCVFKIVGSFGVSSTRIEQIGGLHRNLNVFYFHNGA